MRMSAIGPKRTFLAALLMSALPPEADMTFCGISLSWWLLGVKRTWACALHMSGNDPKRILHLEHSAAVLNKQCLRISHDQQPDHVVYHSLGARRIAPMFGGTGTLCPQPWSPR